MGLTHEQKLEKALDGIHGPRESYRPLLDPHAVLAKICRIAELKAKRKQVPVWSIIGDITSHGSGVSAAIYELYKPEPTQQ